MALAFGSKNIDHLYVQKAAVVAAKTNLIFFDPVGLPVRSATETPPTDRKDQT